MPCIRRVEITIQNKHGENLKGILHETGSRELVIVCHGFRSSKDHLPMANLSISMEKEGISSFRFDFSGNGESEGLFQYGNYYREADDLHAVVCYFYERERTVSALVGHSKGGTVVLLYASKYKYVKTVINISGRFNLKRGVEDRLGKDFWQKIKQCGFIEVMDKRGRLEYRVTERSLMDRLSTDVHAACLQIGPGCRVLTVHGTADQTVPFEDALEFGKLVPNHRLCLIEGADHLYGSHQDKLASIVVGFLRNYSSSNVEFQPSLSSPCDAISSRM